MITLLISPIFYFTGKMENNNSEIKCLCNLAFARSQLKDYSASASTFSEAFTKAQTVNNLYLQFQACEGLGACHYHLKQYSEAAGSFNSALELLDQMEGDTGLVRERVMEKLSDATEAIDLSHGQTSGTLDTHGAHTGNISGPLVSSHSSSTSSSLQSLHYSDGEQAEQLQPQHSGAGNYHSAATKSSKQHDAESSPKPEQRGETLSPIGQPKSEAQPTISTGSPQHFPANGSQSSSQHTGASSKRRKLSPQKASSKSKGKGKEKRKGEGRDRTKSPKAHHPTTISAQDSCDLEIQAYQETLMSSESSSGEEDRRHDTPDHLGSSMFSRHATKSHQTQIQQQPSLTPISSLSSLTQGQSNPEMMSVQEGSLAIGPNARDNYTLQSSRVTNGQKGRKGKRSVVHTEIVPKGAAHHIRGSKESSASGHPPPQSPRSTEQQSKICTIL